MGDRDQDEYLRELGIIQLSLFTHLKYHKLFKITPQINTLKFGNIFFSMKFVNIYYNNFENFIIILLGVVKW